MSAWVSDHDKTVLNKYGTTAPLLKVSQEYGLSYGDVLLYADLFCHRHYDNSVHTAEAVKRIMQLPTNTRTYLLIDIHSIMSCNPNYNHKPSMEQFNAT